MKEKYWLIFLILTTQPIVAFATSSDAITESINYPPDQSVMKIHLEGTYEKIEVPYRTRYPNGSQLLSTKGESLSCSSNRFKRAESEVDCDRPADRAPSDLMASHP